MTTLPLATNIIPSSRSAASLRLFRNARRQVCYCRYSTAPSDIGVRIHLNQYAPRAVVEAPASLSSVTGTGANSSTRCCARQVNPEQDNAYRTAPAGSHQIMNRGRRLHRGHSCSTGKPMAETTTIACGRGNVIPNFCQLGYTNYLPARSSDYRDLKTMRHTC